MSRKTTEIIGLTILLGMVVVCQGWAASGEMPDIVIAWDGSGDYGPQTTGTKTCGWQEALNYCLEVGPDGRTLVHPRDIYVKGGGVYDIGDIIYIRSLQDFKIHGGDYTLNWIGPANKDMIVIDSVMDLRLILPHIVYNGNGVALRIKPIGAVPWDGFPAWIDSQVKIQSIIRTSPSAGGTGVLLDSAANAGISHVDLFFGSIRNFATCISVQNLYFAQFRCTNLLSNNDNSALCVLGNGCQRNVIELGIGVDEGATGVRGLDISGRNNIVSLTTKGGFASGSDLIFAAPASGNRVNLAASGDVADPLSLITDVSTAANNRITWTGAQLPIKTITPTGSTFSHVQRLYPAVARVVGGVVSKTVLRRRGVDVDYGYSRDDIRLAVGDELRVTYSSTPTIQIIPIKAK